MFVALAEVVMKTFGLRGLSHHVYRLPQSDNLLFLHVHLCFIRQLGGVREWPRAARVWNAKCVLVVLSLSLVVLT